MSSSAVLLRRHDFANRGRQTFVTNGQLVYDVLRGGFIQRMIVRNRGSLVVSAGTASGTSLGENPGNLITRFTVDAAPVGLIKNLGPRPLIRHTIYDQGRLVAGTALTGAAGTFTLDQDYYLQFSFPQLAGSIEAALQTDMFTSVQLRLQLGGRDTQFSGNDRTFDFSAVTVDLIDQREFMGGKSALVFEYDITKNITATNAQFNVSEFSVGRRVLSHLYAFESVNQGLVDTIVNNLRVQSGNAVFAGAFPLDFRADSSRWLKDAATALTGLVWVPLSPDYTLGGAIDARHLSQMQAIIDVTQVNAADRVIIGVREFLAAEDLA